MLQVFGKQQLQSPCNYFDLVYDNFKDDFRDYVDQPDHTPKTIALLKSIINTLTVSSANCERGFSSLNINCSDDSNRLKVEHVFSSVVGPSIQNFNSEPYTKICLKSHRDAGDARAYVARPVMSASNRYSKI